MVNVIKGAERSKAVSQECKGLYAECSWLKCGDDVICVRIRARNSFSKTLEMLFRFKIGRKLAGDDVTKPGFFSNRLTTAASSPLGNLPCSNNRFDKVAIDVCKYRANIQIQI